MLRKSLIISALFVCPFASSKPIDLNCYIGNSYKTYFSVKLDEQGQSVIHANDLGQVEFYTTGFFQPNRISYQNTRSSGGATFTSIYEINRTTLSVMKTFIIELSNSVSIENFSLREEETTNFGSCSIAETNNARI